MVETKKKQKKEAPKTAPKKKKTDDFAVIKTGGKQYLVEPGKSYCFEKILGEEGARVNFDEVLLVSRDGKVDIGRPFIKGAKVSGKIISQFKDKKVKVLKYKKRKRVRKTRGHRQLLTEVEIEKIG